MNSEKSAPAGAGSQLAETLTSGHAERYASRPTCSAHSTVIRPRRSGPGGIACDQFGETSSLVVPVIAPPAARHAPGCDRVERQRG